ncbi:hypothetical protein TGAM01_v208648 [Trichoderma gamsii]|uniref:Uncharacterized protein n=1 Tax=Trichoderma gamsii TaxID=398673 RepID=A0A2P4ZE51_9HYPO|nr:hypothetical protein TGAM01_v208648 [Trichoderma gamsii]PON22564.1 hypothetical protein TGAM01_v208648 [Trichoderma gamsii]
MLSFTPKPVPSWDNRPAVSSPLSSSPVRVSSPLSAAEEDARWQPRQVQSSPIRPNNSKFQSRPARPNPVMKRREELQEQRRKGFLQNVRQKAEDRSWQRRDIEGQFLKTSWLANVGRLSHDAPSFSDADIEDAATFSPETTQSQMDEDMIPEELMDEEQLLTSYEEEVMAQQGSRLPALAEEDDEYDDIFAELISQEQQQKPLPQQQPHQQHQSSQPSNQMEID